MAFNYASYAIPQGYTGKAAIGENFKSGFDATRALVNEADAAATLSKFAGSLYGGQQPPAAPGQPQLLSELAKSADPGNRMIAGSQQAATNATDPALANYFASIKGAESSGDPNAKNPNSSATGLYQITDGTWQGLAQKHPDLGLTPDGRTDPMQQEKAVRALTTDNMMALRQSGQPVNPGTLYAAHFLGAGGASQVLGLPDNTPMVSAVPPEVLQANPNLQGMTVGDFKAWANQQGGNGSGGYRPPMEQPQQTADASGGAGGLPPREVLQALFANPETRSFAAQLVTAGQQGKGLTEVQKNYAQAVSQGYRGNLLDYQKELKAGAVTVNTGDNSSKFQNKADELAATRLSDYVSAGNDAQQFTGDMLQLADLSKSLTTGKTAQITAALGPYAEALGIKIDGLAPAQAYDSIISRLAPKMRAPGSGSSSDTDVNMFLRSLPNLGNTPEGNKIIIDTFQGVQQQKIKAAEISQQALSGQITWQQADKQIAALGDPYTAFKKFHAGDTGGGAGGATPPPADPSVDNILKGYGL